MLSTPQYYILASCSSSEPPWWCQMWLLAFLLLLCFVSQSPPPLSARLALLTLAAPFPQAFQKASIIAQRVPRLCLNHDNFVNGLTPPLSPQLLLNSCTTYDHSGSGLHRAQQQAVGLKVGVCEVFRLKWLRNCGRYSAFRCLVLWGSELSYKDMHDSQRHLEIYFFKFSTFVGQKIN